MTSELWEVLESEPVLRHPHVTVEFEQVRLPNERVIVDWPKIYAGDYVNVFAVNEARQAMVVEGYRHGLGRNSWQLAAAYLAEDESPLAAAQRGLMDEAGYGGEQWRHLGSFIVDANRHMGVGHLFLANKVRQIATPTAEHLEARHIRWVPLHDLKQALWDGRVAGISYATNISLGLMALATCYGDLW